MAFTGVCRRQTGGIMGMITPLSTGLLFRETTPPSVMRARFRVRLHARPTHALSRDGKSYGDLRGQINRHVPAGCVLVIRAEDENEQTKILNLQERE